MTAIAAIIVFLAGCGDDGSDGPPALIVTSGLLPGVTVGVAYDEALSAANGSPPYTWSLDSGSLPTGLVLGSGSISGVPTVSGSYSFTVQVTDNAGESATKPLSIIVNVTPQIVTTSLPSWTVGIPFVEPLSASGGTEALTWELSSGALPTGLSITAAGAIQGTPTAAGDFGFTVGVSDSCGVSDTQALAMTVNLPLQITTTDLPSGVSGQEYAAGMAASGGTPPLSWSVGAGSLPAGLSLSSSGAIVGTPTSNGTANFTVQVTDAVGATQSLGLSISVYTMPSNDSNIFRTYVNSASSDSTPPVLTGLSVNPANVFAGEDVLLSATASDDLSGTKSVSVTVSSPSGAYEPTTTLTYHAGNGNFDGRLCLSEYAEPGTWRAVKVVLTDNAGNMAEITSGLLLDSAVFDVDCSLWDITPPQLVTLGFSPTSVPAGESAVLSATITDDVSGPKSATVWVASPSGIAERYIPLSYNAATDLFEAVVEFPSNSEPGTWRVSRVILEDIAGIEVELTSGPVLAGSTVDVSGAGGDNTPPTLDAFTVAPSSAAAGDIVQFYALASDDLSGVERVWVDFASPSGVVLFTVLWYNAATGMWEGNAALPEQAESGNWAVTEVELWDLAGNRLIVNAYELQSVTVLDPASYPPTISNLTVDADNPSASPEGIPPELLGINIAPGTASVGESIRVFVTATDAESGISSASVYLRSPSGNPYAGNVSLRLNSSTGFWEGNFTVSESTQLGVWAVSQVGLQDNAGNYVQMDASVVSCLPPLDISAITSNASPNNMAFTVDNPTAPSDGTPPELLGINIAPGTATVGESIRVFVSATDAESGISGASVYLRSPSGNPYAGNVSLRLNSSTGFWERNFEVSESTDPGVWTVSQVYLRDNAGNYVQMEASIVASLPPLDVSSITSSPSPDNMAFTVDNPSGSPDGTPPELLGINIAPGTASVGESVRIFVSAADAESGVDRVRISLRRPESFYGGTSVSTGYNPATGFWEGNFTVAASHVPGLWAVSSVTLYDRAGNYVHVPANLAVGMPALDISGVTDPITKTTTVVVSNSQPPPADSTPPVINGLTVTPPTVNAGEAVWFLADVTDDMSGVSYVSVRLESPSDTYYVTEGLEYNPATLKYEGGDTIPLVSEDGVWRVTRIYMTDNAGNSTTIYETDPFLQSNPVPVTVSNSQPSPADSTPPVINSLTATPSAVNAGQGVWFVADVTDDVSGVSYVSIRLESPSDTYYVTEGLEYNPATLKYEGGDTIPLVSEDGVWRVTRIYMTDNAGNSTTIYETDPFLQSNPVPVTVSNSQPPPADSTPPVITNIAIVPSAVDADDKVWVMAEATDDISGIDYISVTIKSPSDSYSCSASLTLNPANGRYEGAATIPLVSEDGVWRITYIYLVDNAGNSDTINEGDPFLP